MFNRVRSWFAWFMSFVELIDWHSLLCCELIAAAHPRFKPYGLGWHVLPYSLFVRYWALRVCLLNSVQSIMYADDVFLALNEWR